MRQTKFNLDHTPGLNDVKHSAAITDVGLSLSHEEQDVSYWVESGPFQNQHFCGTISNSKRVYKKQSRFAAKVLFHP